MIKKTILVFICILVFLGWSNDTSQNTPVCTAPGDQQFPQIIAGDFGGSIIVWQDSRGADSDIYAQYLDALGQAQWKRNGIPICRVEGDQENPQIVSDGAGGAIIAWVDKRGGNQGKIYAQRVDASGTLRWASNGISVYNLQVEAKRLEILADGLGGAMISWWDKRDGEYNHLFAQRVDSRGRTLWNENGIDICGPSGVSGDAWFHGYRDVYSGISDGNGGFIFTWESGHYFYNNDIYAQRVDSDGTLLWGTHGIAISNAEFAQMEPRIVIGGPEEFIIAWVDSRQDVSSSYDYYEKLFIQRINLSGVTLYADNGILLYGNWTWLSELQMVSDGGGGAILAWGDKSYCSCCYEYFFNIRTLHIYPESTNGMETLDEIPDRVNVKLNPFAPLLVNDGAGGGIVAWYDDRNGGGDIYAAHETVITEKRWESPVATGNGSPANKQMVRDGAGGAIITWADDRTGDYNIYAQNVCNTGGVGDCSFPVALIEGQKFGGMAPAEITFDGSGSYDPDGKVKRWRWDFGDGESGSGVKVSHAYDTPGLYWVYLRVKDNDGKWSAATKVPVLIFTYGGIEAKFEMDTSPVKAYGKGFTGVSAACYETETDPGREERPIPVDLGLRFTVDAGSWKGEQLFSSGYYYRRLFSGQLGTATIKAMLDGKVMAKTTVEFAWPKAPVNVLVEMRENRSLFRGEYYAHISWETNPAEVFTPAHYRIYRSENGGPYQLAGEVDAATFSFVDTGLSVGKEYRFVVTMVDEEGDESFLPVIGQQTINRISGNAVDSK